MTDLILAPEVVDPEDIAGLVDLLTAAFNEAMQNVTDMIETETNKVTGGFNMPGLM